MATVVHLIGIFTGFVGAGLVYLISDNEFTKSNAKNALNWQIFFTVSFIALLLVAMLDTFFSVLIAVIGITLLFFILNPAFCIWATYRANQGEDWKYPIAPQFI
ncbi:hypothetical protein C495_03487 [Natronorubrum sulfidifaciens JCM 14089]|uniref:DUF4870 domain-containing protein n=1 Tax=Natronorubrum sulfidifaciens JCM 14089 TaxID=1230460 RepID=L9WCU5_9EURY|nr:hypothetical protein C495_03487 [Natronorubrum sulfidifaciens JCM 14089]